MTELVSELEKRGYVYRTRDPSDGRAWIIRFTERGAALDQVARRALQDTEREWAESRGRSDRPGTACCLVRSEDARMRARLPPRSRSGLIKAGSPERRGCCS